MWSIDRRRWSHWLFADWTAVPLPQKQESVAVDAFAFTNNDIQLHSNPQFDNQCIFVSMRFV